MKHLFFALFSLIFLAGCGKKESSISRDEIIETETRKALRHKFDSDPQSKGAVINSLVLKNQGGNKYAGSVEITDPDGSIIKLDLEVTDHEGKFFFETKLPQKIISEKTSAEKLASSKPGTILWAFRTGDYVNSSPALSADGTVYVGSDDNKIYALDGNTGTKIWEFETGDSFLQGVRCSPTVGADDTVYVGSGFRVNKVYALDGKTGTKKWEFETADGVHSSPTIGSDGTVYVASGDNKVYALDGKSGVKKWEFATGGFMASSPALGADGTLYVGSRDKKIYAIKTDSKGLAKSPWPMRGQNAQHTGRAPAK